MDSAEFLFPSDLRASDAEIKHVLIVGSCNAGMFIHMLKPLCPRVDLDYLYFNHTLQMPDAVGRPIDDYAFQFISLSLRDVVTDRVVRFRDYNEPETNASIVRAARESLRITLLESLAFNRRHGLLTFVSNFMVPAHAVVSSLDRRGRAFDFGTLVNQLNADLAENISEFTNVYLFDLNAIANAIGKRHFLDDSIGFYGHSAYYVPMLLDHDTLAVYNAPQPGRIDPLPRLEESGFGSDDLFACTWRKMEWLYRAVRGVDQVKLVIFDLDDTLWRGQIAEHYEAGANWPGYIGWPPGIWEAIHHLKSRGILVAICSKNNEALVRERWDRAVQTGWVSIDDFSFVKINWEPKAENILAIISEASLTPKSVVFVDDNPVEREAVASAIPGIRVIGSNPYAIRRILLWSSETQVPTLSAESGRRDEMVRQQQHREQERSALTREEFLAGLDATVTLDVIASETSPHFARAFELLNKTNQFNTTGRRWTSIQMRSFFENGGQLHVFWAQDKFTDYGLVGVICLRNNCIEQFAMSCRVLGLEVETSVLLYIIKHDFVGMPLTAHVIPTEANMVSRDVYLKSGFYEAGDNLFAHDGVAVGDPSPHLTFASQMEMVDA